MGTLTPAGSRASGTRPAGPGADPHHDVKREKYTARQGLPSEERLPSPETTVTAYPQLGRLNTRITLGIRVNFKLRQRHQLFYQQDSHRKTDSGFPDSPIRTGRRPPPAGPDRTFREAVPIPDTDAPVCTASPSRSEGFCRLG